MNQNEELNSSKKNKIMKNLKHVSRKVIRRKYSQTAFGRLELESGVGMV